MKCQHCGIHYDSHEQECPICGARSGSEGRLSVYDSRPSAPPKTKGRQPSFVKEKVSTKPYRTINSSVSRRYGRNRKKSVPAVVIALVVLGIMSNMASYFFGNSTKQAAADHRPEKEPATVTEDNGAALLYELTGGRILSELPDGAMAELLIRGQKPYTYTLTITGASGIFTEQGDPWCQFCDPEQFMYASPYPPEEYDCYWLTFWPADVTFQAWETGVAVPVATADEETERDYEDYEDYEEYDEEYDEDYDEEEPTEITPPVTPSAIEKRLKENKEQALSFYLYYEKNGGTFVIEDAYNSYLFGGMYTEFTRLAN